MSSFNLGSLMPVAAAAALSAVAVTPAAALYDVHLVQVPFTYDSTDPVVIEFDIQGHNPALGNLEAISISERFQTTDGSMTWVGWNNSGAAQTNQRTRVQTDMSVVVKEGGLSITGGVQWDYSDHFDLGVGQSYPYVLSAGSGSGSSSGNNMSPELLTAFGGPGPVTLTLETSLSVDTYPEGGELDYDEPTGSLEAVFTLSMAYRYQTATAPSATPIAAGQSVTGNFNGQAIRWYELQHTGGELIIDTLGSNDGPDGTSDTTLGLYSALGDLIDDNDDDPDFENDDQYLSRLTFDDLQAGTYYIAVGLYEVEYESDNFNADPSSADLEFGSYQLNVVPEPSAAALCLLLAAPLARRRRISR